MNARVVNARGGTAVPSPRRRPLCPLALPAPLNRGCAAHAREQATILPIAIAVLQCTRTMCKSGAASRAERRLLSPRLARRLHQHQHHRMQQAQYKLVWILGVRGLYFAASWRGHFSLLSPSYLPSLRAILQSLITTFSNSRKDSRLRACTSRD